MISLDQTHTCGLCRSKTVLSWSSWIHYIARISLDQIHTCGLCKSKSLLSWSFRSPFTIVIPTDSLSLPTLCSRDWNPSPATTKLFLHGQSWRIQAEPSFLAIACTRHLSFTSVAVPLWLLLIHLWLIMIHADPRPPSFALMSLCTNSVWQIPQMAVHLDSDSVAANLWHGRSS